MPDCDYCSESFDDEDALLDHMAAAHEGELGRIDQRRVEQHHGGSDAGLPNSVIYGIAGILIVAVIGGAVYAAIGAFSGGPGEIVHEHGTVNVTVNGQSVDLQQYSDGREAFHFHPGDDRWHMEPREPGRLTLADAFSRLGIELTETQLVLPDATYDASEPGTELTVEVNGESVDPSSYTLREGDHIRIAVQTDG